MAATRRAMPPWLHVRWVRIADHVAQPDWRRSGRPKLFDAELVCLAMPQVLLGARSEHHWLRTCSADLAAIPPPAETARLPPAGHGGGTALVCQAMWYLASQCPSWAEDLRFARSTPPRCRAAACRETVKRSDLAGWANYGCCAANSRRFWGLKRYLISTAEGMPVGRLASDRPEARRNIDRRRAVRACPSPRGAGREGGRARTSSISNATAGAHPKAATSVSPNPCLPSPV